MDNLLFGLSLLLDTYADKDELYGDDLLEVLTSLLTGLSEQGIDTHLLDNKLDLILQAEAEAVPPPSLAALLIPAIWANALDDALRKQRYNAWGFDTL